MRPLLQKPGNIVDREDVGPARRALIGLINMTVSKIVEALAGVFMGRRPFSSRRAETASPRYRERCYRIEKQAAADLV